MHAEAIAIINAVERTSDTAALTYRDVCYWPLVRLRLWSALMQRMVVGTKAGDGETVTNTGPTFAAASTPPVEPVGDPALGLWRAQPAAAFVGHPDILFFARPEEHGEKTPAGAFAKVIDSTMERAPGSALKIELADPKSMGFARANPGVFLDLARAGADVAFDPPGTLSGFAGIAAAVKEAAGVTLDQASLLADMGKIFYFARIFEKSLRILGPRAFIHSVYYHPVGMAWMLACRRAGVTSVDLQHGRLGPHHGLYTDLIAAPADGYHLLPDRIWCWGARTQGDIARNKNPACKRHGGIVGGNAWLYKWRYGDAAAFSPPGLAAFEARLRGTRPILVSLQPLESPITPALLDAMREAPTDWLWLLRLHPLRRHTAPEVAALLARAGITRFEIDDATSFPLFTLLRRADHHVTAFSSVVVEAAAFDLRTSLTAPEGLAAFAPEVEQGICRYTPTAAALLAHIREVLSGERRHLRSDFVDMSEGVVDRALAAVLDP